MVDPNTPVWLMRLSAQPNLFAGSIPYVPIPLEEVDEYTKSADYEDDCVKTIETIGILRPVNQRAALLVTMPGSPKRKLRLALDNFDSNVLHPKNPNGHAAELRVSLEPTNPPIPSSRWLIFREVEVSMPGRLVESSDSKIIERCKTCNFCSRTLGKS